MEYDCNVPREMRDGVRHDEGRTHSGRFCYEITPIQTFQDSLELVKEKMLNSTQLTTV